MAQAVRVPEVHDEGETDADDDRFATSLDPLLQVAVGAPRQIRTAPPRQQGGQTGSNATDDQVRGEEGVGTKCLTKNLLWLAVREEVGDTDDDERRRRAEEAGGCKKSDSRSGCHGDGAGGVHHRNGVSPAAILGSQELSVREGVVVASYDVRIRHPEWLRITVIVAGWEMAASLPKPFVQEGAEATTRLTWPNARNSVYAKTPGPGFLTA